MGWIVDATLLPARAASWHCREVENGSAWHLADADVNFDARNLDRVEEVAVSEDCNLGERFVPEFHLDWIHLDWIRWDASIAVSRLLRTAAVEAIAHFVSWRVEVEVLGEC
mmetsp:Transcript_28675/g.77644  ORF Transcript_28675/g.77644 Transcript_28675/m.77644 type:complete len:111 (-) Transcript_28675:153-485(-)